MPSDESSSRVNHSECFKCGAEIEMRHSAYEPWDELITLSWRPASEDAEHVETTDSGGKHPKTVNRLFCSVDCLESFVQMDYSVRTQVDSER